MKISKQWLNDWVNVKHSADEIAAQLTMAGLETEGVTAAAEDFSNVVVAEIVAAEKHPNADKLQVCKVDAGEEVLTIVCGAPNARKGLKVACAKIGAILPGGFKINKAKLRDVESYGMLCSQKELGLAESANGIMELSADAPIGKDFRDYFGLDDKIIEVDLTPNRGDCASMRGIAREVAALNNLAYKDLAAKKIKPTITDIFKVKISDFEACPRYVGRVLKNIDQSAKTPIWMQERLRRCGIRPISPVVDVTNYVLLELGQPMHAFDLEQLNHAIEVRYANAEEKLQLLDETEVELTRDTLVIADKSGPLAIAGVMGGLNSGVTATTKNLFLESAFFTPRVIANKARQYGIQTDSSYRFERGVDYMLQVQAIERATELLIEIVGGQPGPITEVVNEKYLPEVKPIKLHKTKITKLLGVEISTKVIEKTLTNLGFKVSANFIVQIPSHRFDIHIEEDLIEEIARIFGYEKIPARNFRAELIATKTSKKIIPLRTIRNFMRDRDYQEVVTYSFVDKDLQETFEPGINPKPLKNPMSKDMGVMRTNLWPGLIQVLQYNLNRQQQRIRIFETGLRFRENGKKLSQEQVLSGLILGPNFAEQWGAHKNSADFFDLKNDLEGVFSLTCDSDSFEFKPGKHAALHPGQAAEIFRAGESLGFAGRLHPSIAQKLKLRGEVFLFEIALAPMQKVIIPALRAVSKFPSIRRDLAFVIDQKVSYEELAKAVHKEAGDLLVDFVIFDLFHGDEMEKNKKSVAFGLTMQNNSSTLIDSEINEIVERVIQKLEQKFGAELRS